MRSNRMPKNQAGGLSLLMRLAVFSALLVFLVVAGATLGSMH